jgi:hypothetical protein
MFSPKVRPVLNLLPFVNLSGHMQNSVVWFENQSFSHFLFINLNHCTISLCCTMQWFYMEVSVCLVLFPLYVMLSNSHP